MIVQITAKDITLSEHNKAHIDGAMKQFEKYSLDITSVIVVVRKEKNGISVEFEFQIAHNKPVIINQSDKDLDAAIDLGVDRASKALRRMHDKNVTHRGESIKTMEIEEAQEEMAAE